MVELIHLHPRSSINQSSNSLIHVGGRAELRDGLQSSIELVAHDGNDVVAEYHALFVDQSFSLNYNQIL